MARDLQEWVELVVDTPGERYDLSSIARWHPTLTEALGEVDLERSFFWSGQLHGVPEILEDIIATQRYDVGPECVMPVSGGTSMGIFLACRALLRPGDEVVCEIPGWPQVPRICGRAGIDVRPWRLRPENNWQPDTDELRGLVSEKTKLIYINHPHNPTGAVISDGEMTAICDIASRHGAYVLSDEINRGLEWGSEEISPSAVNHYERAISTASMSKSFGATGLRYGWFATRDRQLYMDCYDIYYNSMLCNNHPAELIARRLLRFDTYVSMMEQSRAAGRENLQSLAEMVEGSAVWRLTPPAGSFSCFLGYATGEPSWDFFERMLTRKPAGVEFVPGSCFHEDCEHYIRIGIGHRPDYFREALEVLDAGAREYGG
jgi:aspartate/methionine/tyrosine aminotransferase